MEDIIEYGIEFEVGRQAYKEISKFEKRMMKASKKIADAQERSSKGVTRSVQQEQRAQERALDRRQRQERQASDRRVKQQEREAAAANRQRAKQKAKEARFNQWKLTQFRSAAYDRLTLEQKMNLKSILNSKKTEEEIREEYRKTTAIYAREARRRRNMERNRTRGGAGGRGSSSGGVGGALAGAGGRIAGAMGIAGGGALAAGAAAAVAPAVIIAGGAMATVEGSRQFKELAIQAAQAGVSIQALQEAAFMNARMTDITMEQTAQQFIDMGVKMGEMQRDIEMRDGKVSAGGELQDALNLLIDKGVIGGTKEEALGYIKGSPEEVQKRLFTDLDKLFKKDAITTYEAQFVLDSFASDMDKIFRARRDVGKTEEARKAFQESGVALSDQNVKNMKAFNAEMEKMFSNFSTFPMNVFKGFTDFVSPYECI
jgi:hypothetical protein